MILDNLNRWLTLIANLGVLIGVFLVAYELQQNREAIEAQTRTAISNQAADGLSSFAENLPLLEALIKDDQGQELTPIEERLIFYNLAAGFRRWENIHFQYRQGLYSEEEFSGQRQAWDRSMQIERRKEFWTRYKNDYSSQFVEMIDSFLEE